ncbi:amidase [Mesorhizobium sangaii]|uniref:Amidase/aspartyl-tRNA(Asn)/glutamyl-tRNA(Gln) amidotransferase subunit A n=1 Tax=Mesorhizobium sangaii TaxID=505389 RepID=A0A841P1Q8_9HYPH|nr:amidase [Mesorhizobium sangaii]MBB6409106.1 amidase/aspartyl-tRNA(Asn)/glutamyl-tRNA(Gln) amidotransferase subunit A [Mesorhizobium sangaii]
MTQVIDMVGEMKDVPTAGPENGTDVRHGGAATILDADILSRLTASELAGLYLKRQASPVDVVQAVLTRAASINARFNAFAFLDDEGAIAAAKASERRWLDGAALGPLDGIPATIKDLMTVKNWPTRFGSGVTAGARSQADAPSVAALRAKGVLLVGATTTPEFGWKAVTDSPMFGATSNPWNPALTCGGSSGGAAVAARTGCGNLHLGTDGGGSVRIPAAFTGVVGHKPSFGRVPYYPPSAFGTLGHLGPIARTVEDATLMLDAMTVRDARDWNQPAIEFASTVLSRQREWQGLRIGLWSTPIVGEVAPEILAAVVRVARLLDEAGATVEPINLPGGNILAAFNVLWFAGAANRVSKIAEKDRFQMDPGLLRAAEIGGRFSASEYAEALLHRSAFGAEMDQLLRIYDLVISPTTPVAAFPLMHDVPPGSIYQEWTEWACFNFPINLSQQPACSVPIGLTNRGLPIGFQIVGARGADADVLSAAMQVMELVGWIDSQPSGRKKT